MKKTSNNKSAVDGMVRSGASPATTVGVPAGCNNEQGMALVMALVMLALLGMLGAFALSTSTTEMRITGNYRSAQGAYYATDLAVEYLKTQGDLYPPQDQRLKPGAGDCPQNNDYNLIDIPVVKDGTKTLSVCYRASRHKALYAPKGSGSTAEMGTSGQTTGLAEGPNLPVLNVLGFGQIDSPANSEYAVETEFQFGT